jgi:hypothetical protein
MGYTLNTTVPPYAYGNVTITVPPMGQNGYVYTSSGTNGTWANPGYAANNTAATLAQNGFQFEGGTLKLQGEKADLKINGVSLSETLTGIQEMLGIVVPVHELEAEFDELQQAGKEYRRLLKHFQEQKAVWKTLKTQDL